MSQINLEYNDPLFSIMIVITFIFLTSLATFSYSVYKTKKSRAQYKKLLKRFDIKNLKEDDYIRLYTNHDLPLDSILLLASAFVHKGNYNKAITVYLSLLEHAKDNAQKEEILELLGKTYLKGGFLQRSKEIFVSILKLSPRNIVSLENLLVINEKLHEYDKALEIVEILEELGMNYQKDKLLILTLKILHNPLKSFEIKSDQLFELFKQNNIINRIVVQFMVQFHKDRFWKNIDKFKVDNIIDLLWNLDFDDLDFDVISQNKRLSELFTAKGYILTQSSSSVFELDILISLQHSRLKVDCDLTFEYICSKCKKVHPIYDNRCPHCNATFTFVAKPQLIRGLHEKNLSLQ